MSFFIRVFAHPFTPPPVLLSFFITIERTQERTSNVRIRVVAKLNWYKWEGVIELGAIDSHEGFSFQTLQFSLTYKCMNMCIDTILNYDHDISKRKKGRNLVLAFFISSFVFVFCFQAYHPRKTSFWLKKKVTTHIHTQRNARYLQTE